MIAKRLLVGGVFFILIIGLVTGAATAKIKYITIGTGGTAGTAFSCLTIVANVLNKELADTGYKWSAQASGGSLENLDMLRKEETLMGGAGAAPTYWSYEGIQVFKGKKIRNTRYLTALWPEATQIIVSKASGIKTWKDLKGRKVAVGPPAGGGTFYMPIILKGLEGYTFDDIKPEYLSYGDAAQAMQNGLIDAFYASGGLPVAAVSQIYASRVKVDILEISEDQTTKLQKFGPFFYSCIIPKGTYHGQDRDIKSACMKFSLLARPELPAEIVYKMLEVIYDKKLKEIQQQHHSLSFLSLETALVGLAGPPLHAGAVKFYRDRGVTVTDNFIPPEMK